MIVYPLSLFAIFIFLIGILSLIEVYHIRKHVKKRLMATKTKVDIDDFECVKGNFKVGINICRNRHNKHLPVFKMKNKEI